MDFTESEGGDVRSWSSDTSSQQSVLDILQSLQIALDQNQQLQYELQQVEVKLARYTEEVTVLRAHAGISTNLDSVLPDYILNEIVSKIATVFSDISANKRWTQTQDISLLERLGICAFQSGLNLPCVGESINSTKEAELHFTMIERDGLKGKLEEALLENRDREIRIKGMESEKERLVKEMQELSEETEASKREKEETQASCRQHMKQHQAKSKEKDQEVHKARKLISELRKTTDHQYNELKSRSSIIEELTKERDALKKSQDELRRQTTRNQKDIENKNNAIQLLQKNLKEANKRCQDLSADCKRLGKSVTEREAEVKQNEARIAELRHQMKTKDERLSSRQAREECLLRENSHLQGQLDAWKKEAHEKELENAELQGRASKMDSALQEKGNVIDNLDNQLRRAGEGQFQMQTALHYLHEQRKHIMDRLHRAGYSHWVKAWQQDWTRYTKADSRMRHLHDTWERQGLTYQPPRITSPTGSNGGSPTGVECKGGNSSPSGRDNGSISKSRNTPGNGNIPTLVSSTSQSASVSHMQPRSYAAQASSRRATLTRPSTPEKSSSPLVPSSRPSTSASSQVTSPPTLSGSSAVKSPAIVSSATSSQKSKVTRVARRRLDSQKNK